MPPSFVLAPEAVEDLKEIWEYVASDSIDAADRVHSKIREAIELIAQRPAIGHYRPDLSPLPLRFLPVYSYLIVYDPASNPIEIWRVIHGARDVSSALRR